MIYESLGLPCIEFVADDNDADDYRVPSYFQRLFTLYSKYTKMFCTYHSLTIEISSPARLSRNSNLLSEEKKTQTAREKESYRQWCRNTTMTNFIENIRDGKVSLRIAVSGNEVANRRTRGEKERRAKKSLEESEVKVSKLTRLASTVKFLLCIFRFEWSPS
ncbi:hypothetical protein G5I_08586 [Acromyrmex echinatior]|uniref:Uncharacterized protein n=1 Tax=Acromyrmex echinatior TaxID=103372 RepID=F4WRY1_ACREC|nr:hypothetical protein G5I_08586 [Acromyrmex echinatior]